MHTPRDVGLTDAGYVVVGSNAINESITRSALVAVSRRSGCSIQNLQRRARQ